MSSPSTSTGIITRLTVVTLTLRQVLSVVGWGVANWILDCGCLALSFLAIGAGIPWRGLLLAYGAGQLAANLPITPGGLGVVEGSLTIALVQFGGAEASTVAAVLLYRILSFWAELPVGWATWGVLAWPGRSLGRGRRAPGCRGDMSWRRWRHEVRAVGGLRRLLAIGWSRWARRGWRAAPRRATPWGRTRARVSGRWPLAEDAVHGRGMFAGVRLVSASTLAKGSHFENVLKQRSSVPPAKAGSISQG